MPDDDLILPVPTASGPATDNPKLATGLARLLRPRFAVIDGAYWTDVRAELAALGLAARSLFLGAGSDVELAGPWLVSLDQVHGASNSLVNWVGNRPAAVYWGCQAGEQSLWHHLRTLNQVAIPAWAAQGEQRRSTEIADTSVIVMFRHWDPSVLGSLMPLLDADQFARMLGPAAEILFDTADFGGVRRVVAATAGVAPHGVLRLRSEQMEAMGDRRIEASDRRIMAFLRETAPGEVGNRNESELSKDVVRLRESGASLGLTTERSQAWWAYLMVSTQGQIERSQQLRAYLINGPGTCDAKMEQVKRTMLLLAHSDRPAT